MSDFKETFEKMTVGELDKSTEKYLKLQEMKYLGKPMTETQPTAQELIDEV